MIGSQSARTAWAAFGLIATLMVGSFIWPSVAAESQPLCEGEYDSFTTACFIGTPDAHGVTITDALSYSGQARAYKFRVGPQTSTAHVYLGDLWYDVDMALWRDPPNEVEMGQWNLVAESRTFQQRVARFVSAGSCCSESRARNVHALRAPGRRPLVRSPAAVHPADCARSTGLRDPARWE